MINYGTFRNFSFLIFHFSFFILYRDADAGAHHRAAGDESAETAGEKRPHGLQHRHDHRFPIDVQCHRIFLLSLFGLAAKKAKIARNFGNTIFLYDLYVLYG